LLKFKKHKIKILSEVYKKAGAIDKYRCTFYPEGINLIKKCKEKHLIGLANG
jgi:hypothetical protein